MKHFTLLLTLCHVIDCQLVHSYGLFVGCGLFEFGLFFVELASDDAVGLFVNIVYSILGMLVLMFMLDERMLQVLFGFIL